LSCVLTPAQVLSPITGRVIGAKEIRVGNDKVSISRLQVRVVSGLQLSIVPDTTVENGYIAETLVTRRLTAQYQVHHILVGLVH
jgi:transmembrane protein 132